MWDSRDVRVEIEEAAGRTVAATVRTPAATLEIVADVELVGGVLWARGAHVQGLTPGALGRAGPDAVVRKTLEEADARALVVEGAPRTTGTRRGRTPRPFRFPR